MDRSIERRAFVGAAGLGILGAGAGAHSATRAPVSADPYDGFPAQDAELVRSVVGKSHTDIDGVRELVTRSPALARAAVDWGFGDWESALGAASHMGRRDIAALLIEHGARPDLFTHAMLGHLDVVRASVESSPGIQRIRGPHSFSLLHHARMGGEKARSVAEYLERLGDADLPTGSGDTPAADIERLPGVYSYGDAPDQRLIVEVRNDRLRVRRPPGFPRFLVPTGDGAYHPAGAESVRIVFSPGEPPALTVHDPDPIVRATWMGRD